MNGRKVRFGIIGVAGRMGERHLQKYLNNAHVEVVAICDLNKERAEALAKRHSIPRVYSDFNLLAQDADLDAVSVCVPTVLHEQVVIVLMLNGKHVLVEKPMAHSTKAARKMLEFQQKGMCFEVGFLLRFEKALSYLKEMIASGKLGKIYLARCVYNHYDRHPEGWFLQKRLAGGGVLMDIGCHAINTLLFVLSDPKPVAVYGTAGNHHLHEKAPESDVEDTFQLVVELENDVKAYIECSWDAPFPERRLEILGKEGYAAFFWEDSRLMIHLKSEEGQWQTFNPAKRFLPIDLLQAEMDRFISEIRSDTAKARDLSWHPYLTQEIIEAGYLSADTGEVIEMRQKSPVHHAWGFFCVSPKQP